MIESLNRLMNEAKTCNILVIGDTMLDEWVHGESTRISPEAPVMIVKVEKIQRSLGGAANVAWNATELGCNVSLYGSIGKDSDGDLVSDLCRNTNINSCFVRSDRPTTKKSRILCQEQQVLRIDTEVCSPVEIKKDLIKGLDKNFDKSINGILISDYDKGVLTHDLFHHISEYASKMSIPIYVNAKPHNMYFLEKVRMITMNTKEARETFGYGETDEKSKRSEIFVTTLGNQGMEVVTSTETFTVPTHVVDVADPVGAGDTAFTVLAICDILGIHIKEAALIANLAAALVVAKHGVLPITRAALEEYLVSVS